MERSWLYVRPSCLIPEGGLIVFVTKRSKDSRAAPSSHPGHCEYKVFLGHRGGPPPKTLGFLWDLRCLEKGLQVLPVISEKRDFRSRPLDFLGVYKYPQDQKLLGKPGFSTTWETPPAGHVWGLKKPFLNQKRDIAPHLGGLIIKLFCYINMFVRKKRLSYAI